MIIRPATSADARAIARVHVLSWEIGYRGLVSDNILDSLSIQRRTEFWARVFAEPLAKQRTFVADFSGEVRGFVTGGRCRDEDSSTSGELQAIYVLPEQWDTGTGSALHKVCIDALRADAFTDATLWMVEGNDRALRFYGKHGWKPDGTRKVQEFDGAIGFAQKGRPMTDFICKQPTLCAGAGSVGLSGVESRACLRRSGNHNVGPALNQTQKDLLNGDAIPPLLLSPSLLSIGPVRGWVRRRP